jgi:hypothetical protein
MFISGVNNTGDKLFGGVNNTADKFITSVNEKTVLSILASLHLKMKNKQKFNL